MERRRQCPTCSTDLESGGYKPLPGGGGVLVETFYCPNVANHGRLVDCANECGEQVPNPRYHYHFTRGLYGSGKWSCVRKSDIDNFINSIPWEKLHDTT